MFKKLLEKEVETNEIKLTPISVISLVVFILTMICGYFFFDRSNGLDKFYFNFVFWVALTIFSLTFTLTLSFKKEIKKRDLIMTRIFFTAICCIFVVPVYQSIKDIPYISNPKIVIMEKYEIKKEKRDGAVEYRLEGININEGKSATIYLSKQENMQFKQIYKHPVKITLLPNTRTILDIRKHQ